MYPTKISTGWGNAKTFVIPLSTMKSEVNDHVLKFKGYQITAEGMVEMFVMLIFVNDRMMIRNISREVSITQMIIWIISGLQPRCGSLHPLIVVTLVG